MIEAFKKIYLAHTDTAGRIFYSRLFEILHEVYEEFLVKIGYNLSARIADSPITLPITHAEADFHAPLLLGSTVKIRLRLAEIRQHSFSITYEIYCENGQSLLARALTVHTAVSKESGKKVELPNALKDHLAKHC